MTEKEKIKEALRNTSPRELEEVFSELADIYQDNINEDVFKLDLSHDEDLLNFITDFLEKPHVVKHLDNIGINGNISKDYTLTIETHMSTVGQFYTTILKGKQEVWGGGDTKEDAIRELKDNMIAHWECLKLEGIMDKMPDLDFVKVIDTTL